MHGSTDTPKLAIKAGVVLTAILLLAESLNAQQQVARRQIVVSIPDCKLALIENGEVKRIFPVAVGKETTPSPTGSFQIVARVTDPTYYHQGKVIPPGPANPLGTRWMGLSEKGYGIHGTNAPKSIGHAASHGCIRMAHTDLEQLFAMVSVGDVVEIRGERDEQTARLFGTPADNAILASASSAPQTAVAGQ